MATQSTEAPGGALFPVPRSWIIVYWAVVATWVLALVGVGLSTTSNAAAAEYWFAMVPVYGALCISIAWTRARYESESHQPQVTRQLLHWLGIAVALGLDFLVRGSGEQAGTAAGLNALLLLALGCYLAGVHLEWIFILVGVLLSVTLVVMTKAQQYLWLVLVVGLVAGVALLGMHRLLGKPSQVASPKQSEPRQEAEPREDTRPRSITKIKVRSPQ